MSESAWPLAIERVLAWEGGYVNDPLDAGGETNFGITKAAYPALDIKQMTREQAIEIYKRDYWTKLNLAALPDVIGQKVFDMAVNMGPTQAIKLLQRAANHLAPKRPLAIDGQFGPETIFTCKTLDVTALLRAIRAEASNFYIQIATEHPQMRKFLRGWLRRAQS